jgi:PhzF family phenazine biosynthesis protein
MRRFKQVDVFGAVPFGGNPVAVVGDGEGLSDEQMAAFARWTNLSETTFLLPPSDDSADYRLRIFTPGGELPFAGHPTLGSAHAWLEAGGVSRTPGFVVQECGIGLVRLKSAGDRIAFAAPGFIRSGTVDEDTLSRVARSLRINRAAILSHQWVDNGPGWLSVEVGSASEALAIEPDFVAMDGLHVGVFGRYPEDAECLYEVRAFVPDLGVSEDPVTGSLNAGLAAWLIGAGRAPTSYVAGQGTARGRVGRISIDQDDDGIWVGGPTTTIVDGTVEF